MGGGAGNLGRAAAWGGDERIWGIEGAGGRLAMGAGGAGRGGGGGFIEDGTTARGRALSSRISISFVVMMLDGTSKVVLVPASDECFSTITVASMPGSQTIMKPLKRDENFVTPYYTIMILYILAIALILAFLFFMMQPGQGTKTVVVLPIVSPTPSVMAIPGYAPDVPMQTIKEAITGFENLPSPSPDSITGSFNGVGSVQNGTYYAMPIKVTR